VTAGLLLAFLGYLLIYAGIKGVHPWAPVVEAFGGRAPVPPGSRSGSPESAATPSREAGAGVTTTGSASTLTDAAARAKAAIERLYPDLHYQGGYVCRTINPHDGGTSDEWSEHAWANAIDFTGSSVLMRKLLVWANLPHNRLRFKINNVIPPGSSVNSVHIDFFPSHSGQTPPCAGSPRTGRA
jgi:hypothetical protein